MSKMKTKIIVKFFSKSMCKVELLFLAIPYFRMYLGLDITNKEFHGSMIISKIWQFFVKCCLFNPKHCHELFSKNQAHFICQIMDNNGLIDLYIFSPHHHFGVKNSFFVMQDGIFVIMCSGLEITNKRFHGSAFFGKIWHFVYLTKTFVVNIFQRTRDNLHVKSLIFGDRYKGI